MINILYDYTVCSLCDIDEMYTHTFNYTWIIQVCYIMVVNCDNSYNNIIYKYVKMKLTIPEYGGAGFRSLISSFCDVYNILSATNNNNNKIIIIA